MTDIVIAGGGLGGLAAALFLGRRGHKVSLLERDKDKAPEAVDDAFQHWRRRGVAQCRQSHNFLARSTQVLKTEAPDVLDALVEAGAYFQTASFAGVAVEEDAVIIGARRLAYESVFRRIVEQEPTVKIRPGELVEALIAADADAGVVPHVVGVRTSSGQELRGDLIVDASGRHSQSPKWLAKIGARKVLENLQECGFFYLTRWYRLKKGEKFPEHQPPVVAALNYITAMAFGADNDHFSLTTIMSMDDPLRHAIRHGESFDRFMREVPLIRPWIGRGIPISETEPLTRIDNRRRKLIDDEGPIVTGFVLLGDAAVHTNPTLARGVSLAFLHAQHLAESVAQTESDPLQFAADFGHWTSRNLGVWFTSQVANDAEIKARLQASLEGREIPQPQDETARFTRALFELGGTEPAVGRALARIANLLITPFDILADAEVMEKVSAYLATNPDLAADLGEGPTRAEFEALVA